MKTSLLHLSAALSFIALALLWTFPLVRETTTALPGAGLGDNANFVWNLWWMRQALASSSIDFFFSSAIFAPIGVDLTLHTHTALPAWVGATLLGPLSVVAAQNVLVISSLALNGFAAYLLAFDRLKRFGAALVAGLIYGGSPYISAHLLGHFNLIVAWGLPLFTLCLLRTLERQHLGYGALAGVCLALIAYTDYYYLVYASGIALILWLTLFPPLEMVRPASAKAPLLSRLIAVIVAVDLLIVSWILLTGGRSLALGPIAISATEVTNPLTAGWLLLIVWLWLRWPWTLRWSAVRWRPDPATVRPVLACAAVAVILMAPLLIRAVGLWRAGNYLSPEHQWKSGPSGVDLLALLLPNPMHQLWGGWSRSVYQRLDLNVIEGIGWLGVMPLVLAVMAFRRRRESMEVRMWMWLGGTFFLWSLGPWLKVAGANTGLLLPQNLLSFVPILGNARMPGRGMVVVFLSVAMLAAWALSRLRSTGTPFIAISALLIVADFCPLPFATTTIALSPIDVTLKALPPGVVCELPFGVRDGFGESGSGGERALLAQTVHEHPVLGGFAARVPESVKRYYVQTPVVRSLLKLSAGEASDLADAALDRESTAKALADVGVRYIVLDVARASPPLIDFVHARVPLVPLGSGGARELYQLGLR